MRLSDERLREIIDPGTGMSTDEEVALAAEVRALRECEKALASLIDYSAHENEEGEEYVKCETCEASEWGGDADAIEHANGCPFAALAAVRALEDR